MANKGLFASAVAKFLPRTDAVNREGAPAFAYGPEAKLAQLAATGTLADNFYGVAETQLADVLEAAKAVDPYFVAQAAIYARMASSHAEAGGSKSTSRPASCRRWSVSIVAR